MEKTKNEILEKHCPFKNVTGNTEYFTKEVLDAMREYADQEKEKEAIEFVDFLVKNYQPRFPNKSEWVKISDSNKFKIIYTTTELYQIFKKEQNGK